MLKTLFVFQEVIRQNLIPLLLWYSLLSEWSTAVHKKDTGEGSRCSVWCCCQEICVFKRQVKVSVSSLFFLNQSHLSYLKSVTFTKRKREKLVRLELYSALWSPTADRTSTERFTRLCLVSRKDKKPLLPLLWHTWLGLNDVFKASIFVQKRRV